MFRLMKKKTREDGVEEIWKTDFIEFMEIKPFI